MKKAKPLLYDPIIISRVKQYLEENVDKTYLDVGVMTKHLQERYMEYSRRKLGPFRALVEGAYHVVSQSYGLGEPPSSGDDSDASSLEVMDGTNAPNNLMSNMMNNLYNKAKMNSTPVAAKPPTAEAAIDISSDESGDEATVKSKGKTSNAAGNLGLNKNITVTPSKTSAINEQQQKAHYQHQQQQQQQLQQQQQQQQPCKLVGAAAAISSMDNHSMPLNSTLPVPLGHKRSEHISDPLLTTGGGSVPAKKRKLDNHAKPDAVQLLQHIRRQMQQRDLDKGTNDRQQYNPLNVQRPRKYKKEVQLRKSRETFQDIGGMERTLKELCELLMHIKSPDIYFVLGLMPPRGILLHGPSGCGKTLLAHAIAGQLNLALIEIPATELVAGVSGESEERIRDVFEQAAASAPCVLFIDDIDAISSNRSMAQKDMERRIVSQLISSLDNLKLSEGGQSVLVIGATTRADILDPALRRVGRFDHEISIGIPTRKDRKDILTIICDGLSVEPKCDFDKIAELTPGYVGADLLALVSRAATIAVKRKCADQMRAFQLKTQTNITIVDLDDDVEDSGEKSEKNDKKSNDLPEAVKDVKPEKAAAEVQEKTVEKSPDPERMEVITAEDVVAETVTPTTKETAEVAAEKVLEAKAESEDVEMTVQPETDAEIKENTEQLPEKKNENDTNVADMTAEEVIKSENPSDKESKHTTKVQEPTLFELLNWLDNPPEDITFVSDFCITLDDFLEAVKVVQPLAKREGFITVPDITWDDVGSLQNIRDELKLAVLAPVKYPEELARFGITAPSGVLLCGPPGCGKTLLAKAIANEAGINFISVKGPELMNMYVGESERAVRACFQRARNSAPCVIFFDEFDSLCPKRSESSSDTGSGTRIVNQLLTEMDGVEDRQGVYVLAATNRPDIIDPAILRPGRLDTVLYVGFPEHSDRVAILKAITKNGKRPVLSDDVDFEAIGKRAEGYTGADLAGLVRQAAMLALKESLIVCNAVAKDLSVKNKHFEQALQLLRPSVSAQDRKVYERLRLRYAAPRSLVLDDIAAETA